MTTLSIVTYRSKTDTIPEAEELSWADLSRRLTKHTCRAGKDGDGWSPVSYRAGLTRLNENVIAVSCLVLDIDNGTPPASLRSRWVTPGGQPLAHCLHSSHSSTSSHPKYRLIFPLSAPIPAAEWPAVWEKLAWALAGGKKTIGGNADTCGDVSRFYYLPACPPETYQEAFADIQEGVFLGPADFPYPPPAAKPKTAPKQHQNSTAPSSLNLSDHDVLAAASKASNGAKFDALWRSDTSGYNGDDSAADMALCSLLGFYCQGDEGRVERLFSQSGLGQREKWGREDYRLRTIGAALAGKNEFYTPPGAAIIQRGQKAAAAARNGADRSPDQAQASPTEPSPTLDLALTDIGNGQRLAARHGADLRYCRAWEKWLIWDGQRWQKDDTGEIDRRAKETAQHIYQEAADCPDTARQTELAKHALRSQSHARVQSMIALADSETGIYARAAEWDKRAWLLACDNGTVDLKTGRPQESRRADMGTKRAGTHYDPEAAAPRWEAFLETVLPDAETRAFFQRAAGYTLTGDVSEQCLFFLYGSGSNGKSTALRALMDTLGDYALQAAPDLLIAREGTGGPNNDVAELQGTRLVATIEVEDGKRMAEGLVKQITGGDIIKARFMRQDFFQFEPTHKIFLAANHKPAIRGQDVAIWRRIKMVPFDVQIADADKDPHLADKLRAEMPGILAWAVRGCLDWQRQGLAAPAAVLEATAAYQAGEDVLGDFLGECCLLRPSLRVTAAALYTAYVKWAEDNSERSLSKKNFGARLQEGRRIFPAINIGPKHARGWEGIGLVDTLSATIYDTVESGKIDKVDKSDPHFPISADSIEPREDYLEITSNLSTLSTGIAPAEDEELIL